MKIAFSLLSALFILAALLLVVGQWGGLQGRRPVDLGVREGRLKAPSFTPNSVSSQASLHPDHPQRSYAIIEQLSLQRDGNAASSMGALVAVLQATPGVTVVEQRSDYIYAQAHTRWLKFVDDLEFWVNPSGRAGGAVIEVRSASRLGREDFGVNRQRMEAIRAAYLARP